MSKSILIPPLICPQLKTPNNMGNKLFVRPIYKLKLSTTTTTTRTRTRTRAFFSNPYDDPIVKEALKEPVAFMGGIFAGLLRLDLKEEPLKEWINKTVEASGITEQEIDTQAPDLEDAAQQIDIE